MKKFFIFSSVFLFFSLSSVFAASSVVDLLLMEYSNNVIKLQDLVKLLKTTQEQLNRENALDVVRRGIDTNCTANNCSEIDIENIIKRLKAPDPVKNRLNVV